MLKKCVLLLVFASVIVGGVSAQTDFQTMPKNTLTLDFGPTIIGIGIGAIGVITGTPEVNTTGFGFGVQYERQILESLSLGGRFAYLGGSLGFGDEVNGIKSLLKMSIDSFSLEGHVRYYPFGSVFFLDGMLGYANMAFTLSGEIVGTDGGGNKKSEDASITVSRNFLKLGAKLGWRIDFGNPGGFTFEPSLGYYGGIGLGNTIGKQLSLLFRMNIGEYDKMFTMFEDYIFVGGPRLALSFGWRF
jgi:hypothetical protein